MPDLWGNIDAEEMYQMALAVPLEEKIKSAILLIREFERQALALHPDGYYVAFSGGKDSIVMAKLFEMAEVKFTLNYSNVTIDPPPLVQFIKRYYPEVGWNSVGVPLPYYMVKKSCGPPTRLARWCCEVYKEQRGNGSFQAIGVRAAESARRKGLWKTVNNNNNTGGRILCPLVYWTDADVWQFIRSHNMPYCSLYDEGLKRLGCVGCPMSGPKGMARDFKRWPKYKKIWQKGFEKWFAKYKGLPKSNGEPRAIEIFSTWEEAWDWWISGKANEGDQSDCQMYLW